MKGTPLDLLQKQIDRLTSRLGNMEHRLHELEQLVNRQQKRPDPGDAPFYRAEGAER